MKKKTIISLLAGAALCFSMPSCMDLDETVYDKLPADSFGQTQVELNALVGNVHNTMKRYASNYMHLSECTGSMAVVPTRRGGDWYDGGQYAEIYTHSYTAMTLRIRDCWDNATEAIGTCNAALTVLNNTSAEDVTEAQKQSMLADVRGVRAFWIYVMMDYWGNIPLLTEYSATDKVYPNCTPRQEVFDWLVTELNEIKDICPAPSAATYGSFTQGAAYTLLAKLYLNADAWGVTTGENNYQKVVEYCDKVMGMGYSLEPNWKDNFSLTNQNSSEAILAATFTDQDTGSDGNVQWQLMNNTLHYKDYLGLGIDASGTWNGICAQPEYVRLFDEEDPRFEGTFLLGQMYDVSTGEIIMTDHGNPLNHTIDVTIIDGTQYAGSNWGAVEQHDGARCIKWEYAANLTTAMENDYHIFRLADVYLMKAEALLRGGGSVAEATQLVNDIRTRAYAGSTDHNYASVGLDEVQLERRLELAWEISSRQDDIRFGCYDQGMWPQSNCERLAGDHLKLLPISQDAWQVNPNLKQNPGYQAFPEK